MSVAKVIEVTAASPESFEHAVQSGIEKVGKTVDEVRSAWIQEMKVDVEGGKVKEYRVNMKVTFVLNE